MNEANVMNIALSISQICSKGLSLPIDFIMKLANFSAALAQRPDEKSNNAP